jgi:hypothetical protein
VLEPLLSFRMRWLHEKFEANSKRREEEEGFSSLDVKSIQWQAAGNTTGIERLRSNRYVSADERIDFQSRKASYSRVIDSTNAKAGEDCKLITLFRRPMLSAIRFALSTLFPALDDKDISSNLRRRDPVTF